MELNEYIKNNYRNPNRAILEALDADKDLIEYLENTPWNTNLNIINSFGESEDEDSMILLNWTYVNSAEDGDSTDEGFYGRLGINNPIFDPTSIEIGDIILISIKNSSDEIESHQFTVTDIYEETNSFSFYESPWGTAFSLSYIEREYAEYTNTFLSIVNCETEFFPGCDTPYAFPLDYQTLQIKIEKIQEEQPEPAPISPATPVTPSPEK